MLDSGRILIDVGKKILIMKNGKLTVHEVYISSNCLLSFIPPVSAVFKIAESPGDRMFNILILVSYIWINVYVVQDLMHFAASSLTLPQETA